MRRRHVFPGSPSSKRGIRRRAVFSISRHDRAPGGSKYDPAKLESPEHEEGSRIRLATADHTLHNRSQVDLESRLRDGRLKFSCILSFVFASSKIRRSFKRSRGRGRAPRELYGISRESRPLGSRDPARAINARSHRADSPRGAARESLYIPRAAVSRSTERTNTEIRVRDLRG